MSIISKKCLIITSVTIILLAVIAGGLTLGIILWKNAQQVTFNCQKDINEDGRTIQIFTNVEITEQDYPYYYHFMCDGYGNITFQNSSIYKLTENMFTEWRQIPEIFHLNDCKIQEIAVSVPNDVWINRFNLDLSQNEIKVLRTGAFFNIRVESLNLANNEIYSVQKNFAGGLIENDLNNLNLSYNQIDVLVAGSFSNLGILMILDFSHNLISEVEDYSLPVIRSNGEFNISHNLLSNITKHMLQSTEGASKIDFSFNRIEKISHKAFSQHSYLEYLNFEGNLIKIIESMALLVPAAYHDYYRSYSYYGKLNQTLSVNLKNNSVTQINDNTFSKTLKSLDFSANKIESISKKAFSNQCVVQEINLSGNKLKIIENGTFSYFTINFLTLDDNPIEVIEENSLPDLNSTSYDPYSDEGIYNNYNNRRFYYSNKKDAITLKMYRTNLTKIEDGPFNNLYLINQTELRVLNLTKIKTLNVYCQSNKIEILVVGSETRKINASYNSIHDIDTSSSVQLTSLDLSYNNITSLGNLGRMPLLKMLNLTGNKIKKLNSVHFRHIHNLAELVLSNTNFKTFEYGTSSMLMQLTRLDISNNNLENLDFNQFFGANNLTDLNIAGNNLTVINYRDIRHNLPSLSSINLRHNKWTCKRLTEMIKYFNSITLAYIQIDGSEFDQTNIMGIECIEEEPEEIDYPEDYTTVVPRDDTKSNNESTTNDDTYYAMAIKDIKRDIYQVNKKTLQEIQDFINKNQNNASCASSQPIIVKDNSTESIQAAIAGLKDELKTVNRQTISVLNDLINKLDASKNKTASQTVNEETLEQIVIDEDALKTILEPYFKDLWNLIYMTCIFVAISQIIMLLTVFYLTLLRKSKNDYRQIESMLASRE